MSLDWEMPEPPEVSPGEPPPLWVYVVLFVVIQVAGIALTVFGWPKGQPTMTSAFWVQILVLPLLVWLGISGIIYRGYEEARNEALWWNHFRRERDAYWRRWAHTHLVLVDSVVLTPEDDLAERMLGLEGAAPQNPGKVLVLPGVDSASGQSRLEQVFAQLLVPLTGVLNECVPTGTFEILLQSGGEAHAIELQRTWRKLGLPGDPKIAWLPADADFPMAEHWFNEQKMPNYRLVLACQLHDGDDAPSSSELAAALLLSTPAMLSEVKARLKSRFKLKPQAYLFRPITAESDAVDTALETLLHAGQVPRGKLKHVWFSRLDKLIKHATTTAARDTGLTVAMHDVDRAIGKPGPVNGWLLPALAAQMVQHGQGAQLLAIPYRRGVALSIVAAQPAPAVRILSNDAPLVSAVCALSIVAFAMAFLIGCSQSAPRAIDDATFTWTVILFCPALVLLQGGLALWMRKRAWDGFVARFY